MKNQSDRFRIAVAVVALLTLPACSSMTRFEGAAPLKCGFPAAYDDFFRTVRLNLFDPCAHGITLTVMIIREKSHMKRFSRQVVHFCR